MIKDQSELRLFEMMAKVIKYCFFKVSRLIRQELLHSIVALYVTIIFSFYLCALRSVALRRPHLASGH
jgi:hypothetical protein